MAVLDPGGAEQMAEEDVIWAARGKAIQAYASLEQSLCTLFAHLGAIPPVVAGIIFFRISSAAVRNKILEKLFRLKHGETYNLFFNSFLKQLRQIDLKRNEIVHWNAWEITGSNEAGKMTSALALKPPADRGFSPNEPTITTQDLIYFSQKCDFYMRLCNMFYFIDSGITKNASGFDAKPWLDIFQQPIIYPPPAAHPLLPIPQAPDNPLQSSRP